MLTEMLEIDPYYARARIELGNLYLETDRLGDAIVEFRQAQAAEPSLPDAWQALATGLIRAKRHAEAERVLREALRSIDEARCARLHVTLAELLTQIASDSDDSSYYDDSVAEATAAIKIDPSLEDAFMARGVARFKSDDELGALRDFMHCKGNLIAERNARRLKSSFRRALTQKYYGIPIAALALAQLPFLWLEFRSGAIHEVTFATMVPLFMAIIVLAFVLPSLSKFKFSGVEADLTQIREGPSSSGPTGPRNIVLSGPAPSSVSKGPR
jgi:tetratricopeptide (TPR) repeat protein